MAVPTLGAVAEALPGPEPGQAAALGTTSKDYATMAARSRSSLRRLVVGDLAGMFDGETSPGIDMAAAWWCWTSPACTPLRARSADGVRAVVAPGRSGGERAPSAWCLDEAWAVLNHLATARWLQATFKLSRSFGVANIAVLHRLSDLSAAGYEGSTATLAKGSGRRRDACPCSATH